MSLKLSELVAELRSLCNGIDADSHESAGDMYDEINDIKKAILKLIE